MFGAQGTGLDDWQVPALPQRATIEFSHSSNSVSDLTKCHTRLRVGRDKTVADDYGVDTRRINCIHIGVSARLFEKL